ncbi:MAG TPA: dTDP-4-dehydrorhamnose reductase [Terracidiphilus sp.]|nr:dTDP-4-dehydrorhamnose reductase [Terracidiphilus sp.]
MRVMLIGANGQLGTDLHKVLGSRGISVLPVKHADLDIRDVPRVEDVVTSAQPDVVINTSAFHKVDECEKQPAVSFEVNAIAPLRLAQLCRKLGATLIHISTDYVFDGIKRTPYAEDDLARPINTYGVTKLAGEHLIASAMSQYFLVRTCGLFGHAGSSGKGGNFVENMLKRAPADTIRVVDDQKATPTATTDLAKAIAQLITTSEYGLYQATSEGECSWYEFTRALFEHAGLERNVIAVKTKDIPGGIRRPAYSVLSKSKLASLGIKMPHWRDALSQYLRERADLLPPSPPR